MGLKAFIKSEGINEDRILALLLTLLAFGMVFLTLDDIGITIDEPYVNRDAGTNFGTWFFLVMDDILHLRFLHVANEDVIAMYFRDPYLFHPPFGRTFLGITGLLFSDSLGEIPAYRLATAILFSLSITVLYLMTSHYYGKWAGIAAALSLICIPRAFGLAHIMGLDSMIASMWIITIFTFWKGLDSKKWAFIFAITLAACVNTKVHGYFLLPILIFWGLFAQYKKCRWNFTALVFAAPVFFILFNPTIWHNTLKNLFVFFNRFVHREEMQKIPSFFLGEKFEFNMPWYYPFYLSGITIPPLILLVGVLGTGYIAYRFIIKKELKSENPALLMILSILLLLGLFTAKIIPNYDGVRLFLPVFPCFAFLAGAGFYWLAKKVTQFVPEKRRNIVAPVLLALMIVPSAVSLYRIHPYELSYYNVLVGGLAGAQKKGMENTYWNDPFNLDVVIDFNEKFSGESFNHAAGVWRSIAYYRERGFLSSKIRLNNRDNAYNMVSYRQGWFTPQEWLYYHYFEPVYKVEVENTNLFAVFADFERERFRVDSIPGMVNRKITGSQTKDYLLKIDEDGEYDFGLMGERFVTVLLDGNPFLKNIGPYKNLDRNSLFMKKGFYRITVKEHRGIYPFYLAWTINGVKKGLIDGEHLFEVE